ncbi:PAS sensor protein [Campylobacter volucris]|uniref:PAS sensor protein n=1 Tax=Campylobacter volucris TaxID=1031542 RepID=A0AAE6CZ56_9BACT|nr:PAS sensor protein [Campylobacter volucris]AJC94245.1 PAS sensor-containing signal-transduction protein [Campylobacter volucris LMG 24379]KAB0580400.1 PAS sensor protein [Campylobacter volucris]MBF7045058.1 PAS sensor protein [Campylobacter volucris]QBL13388.1 PAS sensor protein [Campylobacter volucris]QEL08461.1 PAS sensor-containing signal transduction protein [Campylobacter volucris]
MSKEIILEANTLITSKTDLKGDIIYANDDFLKYAGYSMKEILYKPHSIVRHPDMPKTVFKCLWDYIQEGKEIFAFVKNKTKYNDYYWVFTNVTASYDENGNIINYYSVRRKPKQEAIATIEKVYQILLEAEKNGGIKAGIEELMKIVTSYNMNYNQLILALQK